MNKYSESMSHLHMTDEMKSRIIDGVEKKRKVKRQVTLLKWIAVAATLAAAVSISFLIPWNTIFEAVSNTNPIVDQNPEETGGVDIGPAIGEYANAAELAEETHYPISDLANLPFEPVTTSYLFSRKVALIKYYRDEYSMFVYGVYPGTGDQSGVEWIYTEEQQVTIHGYPATLKLDASGIRLCLWEKEGYTYFISDEEPFTMDDLERYVQ